MTDFGFIHRFVPGASDYTLLLLHGTGGNQESLISLGQKLAPEANLLSPRGQVLENGMPRFFRRLRVGIFDEQDIRLRAGELKRFVAQAAEHYGLDQEKVFALGYSNGANMGAALLLLHPGTLAGAALLRPVLPLGPGTTPLLAGKKVFIAAGTKDPWAPIEKVEALVRLLQDSGCSVTPRWEPAGHELTERELAGLQEWASRHIP